VTKKKEKLKCGMVSIVGRPNVGKSTLLNRIVGEKVAIVSRVPQTTRNQVRGIYNDERGQIIFIDTPGLHLGKDRLDKFMNKTSASTMQDADCIIYLVDTSRNVGEEEMSIAHRLKNVRAPIILGLNKVDLKSASVNQFIAMWEEIKGTSLDKMKKFSLVALSAKKDLNIDTLIDVVFEHLSEGPALYPEDIVCDVPKNMVISDIIREKLFRQLKDELPHSVGVVIEQIQPVKKRTLMIKAVVFVERPHQKEIVIGKNGQMLKKIGTSARADLEELLETKVFLDLYVKVQKNWREDVLLLQEQGYGS
jgi:GTP-binding protein Era